MARVRSKSNAVQPLPGQHRADSFDQFIADRICEQLSQGITLSEILRQDGMPSRMTVHRWISRIPLFCEQMETARQLGCDVLAEEVLRIADTPVLGRVRVIKPDGGVEIREEEMLGHRSLQVKSRLHMIEKWHPKRYSTKSEIELKVNKTPSEMSKAEILEALARLKKDRG